MGVEVPGEAAAYHLLGLNAEQRSGLSTSGSRIRWVVIRVLPAYAVTLVLAALSLRLGGARTRDTVRAFNKRFLNPAMMRLAGRRHWYASVIRHRGRRSGNEYSTPVVAVPVEGGFVIPLPYGEEVDWLKNVIAAGHATVQVKGETHAVGAPKIIDAQAALPLLDGRHRAVWRQFGIDRYLELRRMPETLTTARRSNGIAARRKASS